MKELSIEEKAKAYDKALAHTKLLLKTVGNATLGNLVLKNEFENMFPELKELNDERIRKALIEGFKVMKDRSYVGCTFSNYNVPVTDIIAYLEKLGEPTDIPADAVLDNNEDGLIADTIRCKTEKQDEQKIKSKFHKGDWIISSQGILRHIINVDKGGYQTDGGWLTHDTYEKAFHLWTIQDAKDGDVLATLDYILIFKEHLKDDGGVSYCHYDFGAGNPQFIWCEDKNWYFGKEAIVHPATKEQRDLLFQKMHEAGYEWDAENKELKKIEQKPAEWSEEDERILNGLISRLARIGANTRTDSTSINYTFSIEIDWLKSLKDRYTWRPSEEQLTQLYYASTGISYSRATLISLLEQLRKLKG